MFIRTEGVKGFIKYFPLTTIIVVINTMIMIYVLLFLDGSSNSDVVFELGGISQSSLFQREYWRLFTYSFLHLGIYHFLFNNLFLIIFSPGIEVLIGKLKFTLLFFVSILVTAIFILLFTAAPGAGSSGFFFGLLGIYIYFISTKKVRFDNKDQKLITSFTIFSFIGSILFSTYTQQLVTTLGHLGGFIGGIVCGLIFTNMKLNKWNHKKN